MTQVEQAEATEANTLARIEGEGFAAEVFFSPLNQRIQVLSYEAHDAQLMISDFEDKARKVGFGKVFLKAPLSDKAHFEEAGMCAEATIEDYFDGQPSVVMSLFSQRGASSAAVCREPGCHHREDPRTPGELLGSGVARRLRDVPGWAARCPGDCPTVR